MRSASAATLFAATAIAAAEGRAQTGLLVVAHGANVEWNARVRETVAAVRWDRGPVAIAFLMGPEAKTDGWDQGMRLLEGAGAREVVAVPLMVSSAGAHFRQVRFYAGEVPELPAELEGHDHAGHGRPSVPVRVTSALDGAPEVTAILGEVWSRLSPQDRRPSLLVIGHGPSSDADAERWEADLVRATTPLAEKAGARLAVGLLRDDASPSVRASAIAGIRARIEELARATQDSVTVLPVLVSRGTINTATIPKDLAGLPIRYVPASLAPSPHLAQWIERVALATVAGTR